jgi:PHD/YefM family antitoxin component YafN of YafNO toxin-antitoxin module
MRRVSSAELVRNFSVHTDAALAEPVVITRNGRDRLVLLNVELYRDILALALLHGGEDARLKRIADEFRELSLTEEILPPAASKKRKKA